MAEVSNEALALLMVAVLVVTIGAVVSLSWMQGGVTGRVTDQGTASVNITENLAINLDNDSVDFGSGYVNSSCGNAAILNTTGTGGTTCWVGDGTGNDFILNNTGNVNLNITLVGAHNATSLIGGSLATPLYQARGQQGTESGCVGTLKSTWTNIDESTPFNLCDNMSYEPSTDTFIIELKLQIPQDSNKGLLTDTLTFNATKSGA